LAFLLLYAAIHVLDWALPQLLYPLKRLVALSLARMLAAMGIFATASGAAVETATAKYAMAAECTGLVITALFACALYASKIRATDIARALAFYAPFLFAFNVARVLATIWAETSLGPGAFGPAHALSWLAGALVVVILWARVCFGWRKPKPSRRVL